MFLFIDPLYTTTRMGATALIILITAALALGLGLCCANCCSCASCTRQKFCKYFSVTMVLLVITSISVLTMHASPDPFTARKDSMVTGILSSIVSSAMLALSGYICKKLVWNKITQEVREFDQVSQSGIDRWWWHQQWYAHALCFCTCEQKWRKSLRSHYCLSCRHLLHL